MLSTAIIIFREILEIAMILGVVLASTRGLPGRMTWIAGGFFAGLAGAGLVAVFAQAISESLSGMGQEFFNALILFTAAVFIGWMVIWMRQHAHKMTAHLRQVGKEVVEGKTPLYTLAIIIGLAILREGSEIVLFIYGMILSGQGSASIIAGSTIGLVLGTIVGTMLYYGLLKIPARHMLRVTSWLLILLVSGLASQGAGYLSAAGYFTGLSHQMWDTSWLLSEEGIVGKSLHSLIGYTARPTLLEIMVYAAVLCGLLAIITNMDRKKMSVAAVALMLSFAAKTPPAYALDEIYSPNVEYRELSLEYNGSRTFDNDPAKNNAQEDEIALEAGLTPRWEGEISAGFAKDPGDNLKMEDFEVENRFQFFEQGENWMDSGILAAYDFSTQSHTPDTLEVKLLLQKDIGWVTSTTNIGFEQPVGTDAHGGPDYVFLWNTRYRYSQYFQPGVEIQSDLGQDNTLSHFNEQQHYIGPAVYGKLFGHLNYQAAWLAGVTSASAQSAARLLVEYELHF